MLESKFVNRLPLPYRSRFSLTLTERRRFHTAIQIFRSLHRLSPPYLHNIFQLSKDITGHVSRNINRVFVPRVFTNYGKRSFFYRGALLWNSLPLVLLGLRHCCHSKIVILILDIFFVVPYFCFVLC